MVNHGEDAEGNLIFEHFVAAEQRFIPETMYLLVDMMKGVIKNGSGRSVKNYGFASPAIGKTGTTNDFRDSWFVGATSELAAVSWVGYDDNRQMELPGGGAITGASGGLPIWARFMTKASEGRPLRDFDIPANIEFAYVNELTGEKSESGQENTIRLAIPKGTIIPEPSLADTNAVAQESVLSDTVSVQATGGN